MQIKPVGKNIMHVLLYQDLNSPPHKQKLFKLSFCQQKKKKKKKKHIIYFWLPKIKYLLFILLTKQDWLAKAQNTKTPKQLCMSY